jgi:hypothetical protein
VVRVACLSVAGILLISAPCFSAPLVPRCNTSVCQIPEDGLYQLPFTAIAGDVILREPGQTIVSDIFRIFNNLVNTGSGTGLGNMVFLYSSDDTTPLPAASTYSSNAVFLFETPGYTSYFGNGTNYLLGTPEPGTWWSFILGIAGMRIILRGRRKSVPPPNT